MVKGTKQISVKSLSLKLTCFIAVTKIWLFGHDMQDIQYECFYAKSNVLRLTNLLHKNIQLQRFNCTEKETKHASGAIHY